MAGRIIFNADDFGISRGVNEAICRAHKQGILNSTSLMVNQKYAKEAVKASKTMPNLELGLHINLTNEYPTLPAKEIPLLTGKDGKFKNGFVKLLLLSIFKYKDFSAQVKKEIEAQILKAQKLGVTLKHIDGHRHVQMIPAVFAAVKELAEKYHIGRIRTVKECGLLTVKNNQGLGFLFDGGAVKYYLLRFLDIMNGYPAKTYFYTMLYTCKLSKDRFAKVMIPEGFDVVEVMIHPGLPEVDAKYPEDVFDENILSPWRKREFETLMDKNILNNFVFGAKYPWPIAAYLFLENIWFKLNQKIRFLLVGGFNTVLAYGIFALLFAAAGLPYIWALVVQNIVTINISIFTMRYYVFRSKGDFLKEYCKSWGVYLWMFLFNSVALTFLVEVCRIYELWAQAIYLTVATIMTYLLHKYFSFRKKIKEK